ncbi:MAG: DegV family protein, partial [Actinomycetales bacterium]|nr:DegV family protein [Actinomycetales bacterium]
ALKPLLSISDGEIGLAELSRNTDRSLTRLVELARKHYEPGATFSVLHVAAPERAEKVAAAIQLAQAGAKIHVAGAGAVVAAHLGPGAIALSISPMP